MFQLPYRIRSYDIDWQKRLSIPALLRIFNEAAMENVLSMGLSVFDLEPHQMGWVLLRLRLDIKQLPTLGQQVTLETYPAGFERAFTYRDYRLLDETGSTLISGASTWILLHLEKRRPLRIPDWIKERAGKLPAADQCQERPPSTLAKWQAAGNVYHQSLPVSWFDLDFNQHVSNAHYGRILLESTPPERLDNSYPSQIQIHYLQEARKGDILTSSTQPLNHQHWQHRLTRDETILAVAETKWKE